MASWRWLGLTLFCTCSLLRQASGAKFVANPASRLSQDQRKFIDRLWKPDLALSDSLIRQGYKHEIEGRNWARLAEKLQQEGSNVTIVAFGGSVTVGYRLSNTSYPEEFVAWLQGVFPKVNFKLISLARRATAATFAALCLVQEMPTDADLVLIEYSINGYGGQCQCFTSPQTAGYETLIRKIIRRAPTAAMLGFATFMWLDKENKPGKYYETGEDQHGVVCRRYGVPMMSVRDAMYDEMFEPHNSYGVDRSKILVDIVHVGDYGAKVYASFLAWALRHQVTRNLLHHHGRRAALSAQQTPQMPNPLNPEAAQEDWPTFCAEGLGVQKHVADNQGWQWVDEGTNACAGESWGRAGFDLVPPWCVCGAPRLVGLLAVVGSIVCCRCMSSSGLTLFNHLVVADPSTPRTHIQ
eukprot:GHUV01009354.1.p1 GENE.GHUV01009354.1~~GHUV01009354.1.p1  ORF type:complete len:410 (+),score=40.39 GHUV01009354.1:593-1822(+)